MTRTEDKGLYNENDSYYILLNVSCPAVIVECGFLTNAIERDNLLIDEYQGKVALSIKEGVIEYFTEK
jgi:N-acetylmuramoyl-L-alanine amidase